MLDGTYLWSSTEKATSPGLYAPYLTYAYVNVSRAGLTQSAGIKIVVYTNPLMPGPDSQREWPLMNPTSGTYYSSMATSCTGTAVRTFSGTNYLANVLDPYDNGAYTVNNAAAFVAQDLANWESYFTGNNPGYMDPVDYFFVDDADDYGASPSACNDSDRTVWATGIANTMTNAGVIQHPILLNALGVWYMGWAQAQQNALASPNVAGGEYEKCYAGHGWNSVITGDYVADTGKTWLEAEYGEINTIVNQRKLFWCYAGNTGDAAGLTANRIYTLASFLLSYDPNLAIYEEADASSPSTFQIFPEMMFVPLQPKFTATSDVTQYQDSGGAYYREFAYCYYSGNFVGPCEVVVNPSPTATVPVPNASTYAHSMVVSGDGVLDGGTLATDGPPVTSLAPTTGAVLFP